MDGFLNATLKDAKSAGEERMVGLIGRKLTGVKWH